MYNSLSIYSFYQRAKRSFRKHWSRQEIDPTNDLIDLNNMDNLDIINDCDGGTTTVCILKDETLLLTNGNTASAIPIKVMGHPLNHVDMERDAGGGFVKYPYFTYYLVRRFTKREWVKNFQKKVHMVYG